MRSRLGLAVVWCTCAFVLVSSIGCREQTPGERAGAVIDETLDRADDVVEETEDAREEALSDQP